MQKENLIKEGYDEESFSSFHRLQEDANMEAYDEGDFPSLNMPQEDSNMESFELESYLSLHMPQEESNMESYKEGNGAQESYEHRLLRLQSMVSGRLLASLTS
jgi:hypothetical protein